MTSKENTSEINVSTFQTTNEWMVRNKLRIMLGVFVLVFTLFIWMTIWGIQHEEHYFKFNITSILFGSLYLATIYLCISIGLNMTYDLIGFANFAHAEYFIIGAYMGVFWSFYFDENEVQFYHFFIVLLISFTAAGLAAVLGDILIFAPLRKRGTSNESLMISSIGWGIILRNMFSIYFGGDFEYFRIPQIEGVTILDFSFSSKPVKTKFAEEPFEWPSILIGSKSGTGFWSMKDDKYFVNYEMIFSIVITAIIIVILFYFLEKTKTGTALRATSDNIDLAESSGINTDRMIKLTWFIGGGLAGIAGLIFVLKNPVIPFTGFLFLLPAFAVMVLGGVGSLKGSVFAALIIGFAQTLSKPYLAGFEKIFLKNDDFEYRGLISGYDGIVPFVILIIIILFRPQGLFGEED